MNPLRRLRKRLLYPLLDNQEMTRQQLDDVRIAIGDIRSQLVPALHTDNLQDVEFQVFSQAGEDGILQHLVRVLGIPRGRFLEIGVGNYSESNTRFLLVNNDWEGVAVDANDHHISFITNTGLRWKYKIDPVVSFVTTENINDLVTSAGELTPVDLLSIDIDGNDYWVLDALRSPPQLSILVVEYNSLFGSEAQVVVPYTSNFDRWQAHFSGLYWGSSLGAIAALSASKGFQLVGTNKAGTNAFFVSKKIADGLPAPTVQQAYTESRFRDARGEDGEFLYLRDRSQALALIEELPVWDLDDGTEKEIADLLLVDDRN